MLLGRTEWNHEFWEEHVLLWYSELKVLLISVGTTCRICFRDKTYFTHITEDIDDGTRVDWGSLLVWVLHIFKVCSALLGIRCFSFLKRCNVKTVEVSFMLGLSTNSRRGVMCGCYIFQKFWILVLGWGVGSSSRCVALSLVEGLRPPLLPFSLCRNLAGLRSRCWRDYTDKDWCSFRESNCCNPFASLDWDLIQIRVQMNSTKIYWRFFSNLCFLGAGTEREGRVTENVYLVKIH